MTETHWERVKAAVEAVLEQKPSSRPRFLERLCGHDEALFDEVRSLVEAYDDAYLETPVAPQSVSALAEPGPVPETIGPYRVVKKIGAGGMGEVYKVVDDRGQTFALKTLIGELVTEKGLSRLRREATAASALEHPNIVRVVALAEYEGTPYVLMEYLEGRTLHSILSGGRRLELGDALTVAIQVAEGLACAHDKGVVHRDLKPGNVFLTHSGRIKVLDFGIAKMLDAIPGLGDSPQDRLTKSGEILGTQGFMAPEQARGEKVDARADIFSFGCLLYQMVSGKTAFSGKNVIDRYVAIVSEEPPRLKQEVPSVPGALDKLVHRTLAKKPQDRPRTMHDVLKVLRRHEPGGR